MERPTPRLKKGKPHNARPYDRPNQGILGKVASKVKGLFNSTWLFNVPQWMRNSSEEEEEDTSCACSTEIVEDEDNFAPQNAKRQRLSAEENPSTDFDSRTRSWLENPSSQNPCSNIGLHFPASASPRPVVENKDTSVTINGASLTGDDHSDNSEGSASTSGCSSFVSSHKDRPNRSTHSRLQLTESALENLRGELRQKSLFQTPKMGTSSKKEECSPNLNCSRNTLWSSPSYSGRSFTVANSSRPNFNVTAFCTPSKLTSQAAENKVTSPFYKGKTSFGGAASSRRMPTTVAPYQTNKSMRNQIRVRESSTSDDAECMSSAARRILQTLEKMSSPVTDARKIPNTNRSPVDLSLYMNSPKHRNSQIVTDSARKGPPIANINTITKLTTLKSYTQKRLKNSSMEIPYRSELDTSFNDHLKNLTCDLNLNKEGGGKMKRKMNQQHLSKDTSETELLPELTLPDVPLPISSLPTINLPPVNFGSNPTAVIDATPHSKSFTFSNPVVMHPSTSTIPKSDYDFNFKFSSPLPTSGGEMDVDRAVNSKEPSSELYSGSVNSFLEILRREEENNSTKKQDQWRPNGGKNGASDDNTITIDDDDLPEIQLYEETANENIETEPSMKINFFVEPGSWECTVCLVRNKAGQDTCAACTSPRPNGSSAPKDLVDVGTSQISGFGDKFKPEEGSWECSVCMVRNKTGESKCVACETPKPGAAKMSSQTSSSGFAFKSATEEKKSVFPNITHSNAFKSPTSSAEVATFGGVKFGTATTQSENQSASSASFGFTAQKPTTWVCDTCSVSNPIEKSKCIACETFKPTKENNSAHLSQDRKKDSSLPTITFGFANINPVPDVVADSSPNTQAPKNGARTTTFLNFNAPEKQESNQFVGFSNKSNAESEVAKADSSKAAPTGSFGFGGFHPNSRTADFTFPQSSDGVKVPEGLSSNNTKHVDEAKTSEVNNTRMTDLLAFAHSCDSKTNPALLFSNDAKRGEETKTKEATNNRMAELFASAQSGDGISSNGAKRGEEGKVREAISAVSEKANGFGERNALATGGITNVSTSLTSQQPKPSDVFSFTAAGDTSKSAASGAITSSGFTFTSSSAPALKQQKPDAPLSGGLFTFNKPAVPPVSSSVGEMTTTSQPTNAKPISGFSFTSPTVNSFSLASSTNTLTSSAPLQFKTSFGGQDSKPTGFAVATSATPSVPASTTSVTSSGFSFGAPAVSSAASATFPIVLNFGASANNTSQAHKSGGFIFKPTNDDKPVVSANAPAVFGTVTPSTTAAVTTSGFTFGTPKSESQSSTALAFTFGSKNQTSDPRTAGKNTVTSTNTTSGGFGIKSMEEDKTSLVPSNNAFGAFKQDSSVTSSTQSSTGFKFGSSAPSGGGFTFCAPNTEVQNPSAAAAPFSFGTGTTTGNTSYPVFQQMPKMQPQALLAPTPTPTPAPTPAFQFGTQQPAVNNPAPSAFATPTGGFTFGIKGNEQTPSGTQNPMASFGVPQVQPMFGGAATSNSVFGAPAEEKPPAPTGGFNFGVPGSQPPVFRFGAQAEKKQATPQGFNFAAPRAEATPFPGGFNMSTPPSFNFGATSTPAAASTPFQFAAGSSDGTSGVAGPRKIRKALRRGIRKE